MKEEGSNDVKPNLDEQGTVAQKSQPPAGWGRITLARELKTRQAAGQTFISNFKQTRQKLKWPLDGF